MKEEWLFPNATIPVDIETTSALLSEIKRLIDIVGGMALKQQQEREKLEGQIQTLHVMYELASKQRDTLMGEQRAQVEAMRGRLQ